ncbi:MAG: MerR family transcriptional regulator [Chloroflexota bacterium]|nr:MerR family transcriptional regulator [Chloroflexota bacterium]
MADFRRIADTHRKADAMQQDELTLRHDEPVFIISVAARMLGVQTQTLRYYERIGLIEPARTGGNQRVFSRADIERVRRIRGFMDDLGVNLAGVEVILRLLDRLNDSEAEVSRLSEENAQLRDRLTQRRG